MQFIATIDCGTTNSRIKLLQEDGTVIAEAAEKIGVKDTAVSGSREVLKRGLRKLLKKAADKASVSIDEINYVLASGMLTSEIGLLEIPHLEVPAGKEELADNIKIVKDDSVFHDGIQLVFIRGLKNKFSQNKSYEDLEKADFMRGEETQIIGLLQENVDLKLPMTVIFLSSHTKYVNINQNKMITGSLTTLSGQLYEAILSNTSISKSVMTDDTDGELDKKVIDKAFKIVNKTGFIRSLLVPRLMDVLFDFSPLQRKIFLESAIASEDLKTLNNFDSANLSRNDNIMLIGQKIRCNIFSYLLENYYSVDSIKILCEEEKIDDLSTRGALAIVQEAGLI